MKINLVKQNKGYTFVSLNKTKLYYDKGKRTLQK